jgi:hypothetical protein
MPVVLILVGLAGATYTSGQRTNGWIEIPMHWWSTVATAPVIVGVILLAWRRRSAS